MRHDRCPTAPSHPMPDVTGEVLNELGYRWADRSTRRRRMVTALLSGGAMICLAAIAGSGVPWDDVRSGGSLGTTIGRLGSDLGTAVGGGLPGLGDPDALARGLAELGVPRGGTDSASDPESGWPPASNPAGPETSERIDPVSGDVNLRILATAPWRPV